MCPSWVALVISCVAVLAVVAGLAVWLSVFRNWNTREDPTLEERPVPYTFDGSDAGMALARGAASWNFETGAATDTGTGPGPGLRCPEGGHAALCAMYVAPDGTSSPQLPVQPASTVDASYGDIDAGTLRSHLTRSVWSLVPTVVKTPEFVMRAVSAPFAMFGCSVFPVRFPNLSHVPTPGSQTNVTIHLAYAQATVCGRLYRVVLDASSCGGAPHGTLQVWKPADACGPESGSANRATHASVFTTGKQACLVGAHATTGGSWDNVTDVDGQDVTLEAALVRSLPVSAITVSGSVTARTESHGRTSSITTVQGVRVHLITGGAETVPQVVQGVANARSSPADVAHALVPLIQSCRIEILGEQPMVPAVGARESESYCARQPRLSEQGQDPGTVPRRIHMSYRTRDGRIAAGMWCSHARWKHLHPTYDFVFYDDDACRRLISNNFSSGVVDAYDTIIPTACKSDLFRSCAVLLHGGVYMDAKLFADEDVRLDCLLSHKLLNRHVAGGGRKPCHAMCCKEDHSPADLTRNVVVWDRPARAAYNGFFAFSRMHAVPLAHIEVVLGLVRSRQRPSSVLSFGPLALYEAMRRVYGTRDVASARNGSIANELRVQAVPAPARHVLGGEQAEAKAIPGPHVYNFLRFGEATVRGGRRIKHIYGCRNTHAIAENYGTYRRDQDRASILPHYARLWSQNYVFRTRMYPLVDASSALTSTSTVQMFATSLLLPGMHANASRVKRESPDGYAFLTQFGAESWVRRNAEPRTISAFNSLPDGVSKLYLAVLCLLHANGGLFVDLSVVPARPWQAAIRAARRSHGGAELVSVSRGPSTPTGHMIGCSAGADWIMRAIHSVVDHAERHPNTHLPSPAFGLVPPERSAAVTFDGTHFTLGRHVVGTAAHNQILNDLRMCGANVAAAKNQRFVPAHVLEADGSQQVMGGFHLRARVCVCSGQDMWLDVLPE